MTSIVATAFAATTIDPQTGISWWQTIGGMIAVFALLLVCLKLLGRLQGRGGRSSAHLLDVWQLGPRREVQVLQLGDDVSYVYRHDNAMVLLKQQTLADHEREHGSKTGPGAEPRRDPISRLRNLLPVRRHAVSLDRP